MNRNYHKIILTGPESTGKTTLAKQLATHYNTVWVSEYARDYLERLGREYKEEDLLEIAKGQVEKCQSMAKKATDLLILDTSMLVMKVWSNHKYGKCHPWISNELEKEKGLYLLCGIDTPWEYDPMREHPNERNALYEIYEKELKSLKKEYIALSGNESERLQNVIVAIDERNYLKTSLKP